ncbi:hypothetical protein MTR67_031516 [Solanum verrucosum]|uniref:Uncharacterized protein n=1 Tax=Solanum verrucosum TaxID=315347 RepID=A0AAF0ZDW7_SOLVR|nr:hypothetical protein MTR67_031516 [Solanum verrucosum]
MEKVVEQPSSKDFFMEFVTRFRFSPSRSRIDRFLIFSSAVTVIMSPRRAYVKNVNACNANIVPLVLDHEVSNAEFRNVIQLLAESMTTQNN